MLLAHCRGCHNTFAGINSFDIHRLDESVPEDQNNTCWEPESMGLVLTPDGIYGTIEEIEKRQIVAERLGKARAARGNAKS
jgi:hypothetical protein